MNAPSKDPQLDALKVPPHSIEAEQSVIGGLLLDNAAWDRIADVMSHSDFYRYEHRHIYSAIGALVNATKPADVITVFEQLQSLGKADECGGLVYLNALAQSVPSAANLRRYAEIVRERAVLRKLVSASDEIATSAFNPQGRQVSEILDEAESKIFKIGDRDFGGIMTKPAEMPVPAWNFYINVPAIDAAITRISEGGGAIVNGPMEVPGGSWIVQATDPQGAFFSLVAPIR